MFIFITSKAEQGHTRVPSGVGPRMAKFVENFQGKNESILCPLCSKHIDNQKMSFEKLPSLEVKHQNIRQS